MTNRRLEKNPERHDGVRRALIFLAFTAGAVTARLLAEEQWPIDRLLLSPLLLTLVFGAVLVLASSVLGIALLPICAFSFGVLTGRYAELLVGRFLAGEALDLKGLSLCAVVVPLFFAVSVKGMLASELLGSLLDGSGASARAEYNREYVPIAAVTMTAVSAVYFLAAVLR